MRAIRAPGIAGAPGDIPNDRTALLIVTFLRPVALGARKVEDDFLGFGVEFAVDGALGVEDLVGDVGHDGGTARGNTAFGDEDEEAGEILVDGESCVEFGGFGEEVGGEVFEVDGLLGLRSTDGGVQGEMAEAEAELRSHPGKTAALAVGKAVLAAGRFVLSCGSEPGFCRRDPSQRWLRVNGSGIDNGSGASGFWVHGFLFF
jgi:hypothetical protein